MEQEIIFLTKLDNTEVRVLACLVEKSKITPEYYPMTINSIVSASNQKTSRKPIVNYDENIVIEALASLKKKGLVSTVTGGTSRVIKYKHNFQLVYPVDDAALAIMCLLMLRGPQTPGEININSGRLYSFESIAEVYQILEALSDRANPYVKKVPRKVGQKEGRYIHLLSDIQDVSEEEDPTDINRKSENDLEAVIRRTEQELTYIRSALDKLLKELNG